MGIKVKVIQSFMSGSGFQYARGAIIEPPKDLAEMWRRRGLVAYVSAARESAAIDQPTEKPTIRKTARRKVKRNAKN